MAREQRRLLISPERLAQVQAELPLTAEERHYLQRVLRLRPGERFAVVDGAGHLWQAALEPDGARLLNAIDQPDQREPAPHPRLQLGVALPRRDADVLLRMVCELGIDAVQPLVAERSVAERWNPQRAAAIVREAVEQCERLWCPTLSLPLDASAWWNAVQGVRLLATTRRADQPSLEAALSALPSGSQQGRPQTISLAIGPEGGWSPAEEALAIQMGWQAVSLGPTILRTSTAAVAAATLLSAWRASR